MSDFNENSTEQKKRGKNPLALVKILVFAVFAIVIATQGFGRIQAANALIGSTALSIPPGDSTTESPAVSPSEPVTTLKPEPPTVDDENPLAKDEYNYIDAKRLESKSATDLAVWYLTHFPKDKNVNEQELKEFNDWYKTKIAKAPDFATAYKEAIAYTEAHPELLQPPATPSPSPTTPAPGTTPDSGGITPPTPPHITPPPVPTPPPAITAPPSKYKNIDETMLNKSSAAEVANWVFSTFPPDSTSWNYPALTDYYSWLEARGKTDSAFVASVNGYLQVMGWTNTAG